jgi:hypothetical protein
MASTCLRTIIHGGPSGCVKEPKDVSYSEINIIVPSTRLVFGIESAPDVLKNIIDVGFGGQIPTMAVVPSTFLQVSEKIVHESRRKT